MRKGEVLGEAAVSGPVQTRLRGRDSPIFIAGPGRAGTTLMTSLLSAHSRIAIPPETHYMKRAYAYGAFEREAPDEFDSFWRRYVRWSRFRDLEVDPERCHQIARSLGGETFRNVLGALLLAYAERNGKPRVGEKTPGHVRYLGHLLRWFPDARVVLMLRDPRAVIASQLRSPWVRVTPASWRDGYFIDSRAAQIAHYAQDWLEIQRIATTWYNSPQVRVQRYEALVDEPEQELRALCAFLGESYEPQMLDERQHLAAVPAATSAATGGAWDAWLQEHHSRSTQSISRDSLEKWRTQLSPAEVAMIEGVCASGMEAVGYTPLHSASRRRAGAWTCHSIRQLVMAERGARASVSNAQRAIGLPRR